MDNSISMDELAQMAAQSIANKLNKYDALNIGVSLTAEQIFQSAVVIFDVLLRDSGLVTFRTVSVMKGALLMVEGSNPDACDLRQNLLAAIQRDSEEG